MVADGVRSRTRRTRLDGSLARAAKRAVDLALAVPLLLVVAPAIGVLAVLVRIESRGPSFFRQERIGRDGRPITVWKLRTMRVDAEQLLRADPELHRRYVDGGFKLPADSDPRLTRMGKWMRRFSVDELPQLGNVISGSMSLVGPRPVLEQELGALYGDAVDAYLSVKPGLTGLWQVSGRSEVIGVERADLDTDYVRGWTLRGDLALLARTLPAVLHGRGAH